MALDRLGSFIMNRSFKKLYDEIMAEDIGIYERCLLCFYISRYEQFGKVFTSDESAGKYLGISRQTTGKHRRNLEKGGYITSNARKGQDITDITITKSILEKIGVELKENKNGEINK